MFPHRPTQPTGITMRQFVGGGHFGIELSSVNNPDILETLLEGARRWQLPIARVVECRGIFRLADRDIRRMVDICHSERVGLYLSVGPRAPYDTGGFVRSKNGFRVGYRLRESRGIEQALDDIRRAMHFGVRGILIYDEGLLDLVNEMKNKGDLPQSLVLKVSVHMGCANPYSARLYERLGAGSINPIPDLSLDGIAELRESVRCPLDLFTDTAEEAGGLLRTADVGDFVRLAAPVYLKCGPISQPRQNHLPTPVELEERLRQTRCVVETLQRQVPQVRSVGQSEPTLALPLPPAEGSVLEEKLEEVQV